MKLHITVIKGLVTLSAVKLVPWCAASYSSGTDNESVVIKKFGVGATVLNCIPGSHCENTPTLNTSNSVFVSQNCIISTILY